MQRRQLLSAVGGSTVLAIAGCLSSDRGAQNETTTTMTTSTTPADDTTTTEGSPEWNPGADEPFETFTVGSRNEIAFPENNKAHEINVWNNADEDRTFSLTLDNQDGPGLNTDVEFQADGWAKVVANEPATYTLTIAIDGTEAGVVRVERSRFDCNSSKTNIVVTAEGDLISRTITTLVACPGPSVAGRSFSYGKGSCNMEDLASVHFKDKSVRVAGNVKTPNPCYGLELASVEFRNEEDSADGTDDLLEVTVTTTGQQTEVCTSCVGSVPYTATVDFENDYPSSVRVVHETMGAKRTVTTVSP